MSMDMIRGKEKNIIISGEKKNKIYLFSFTRFFLFSYALDEEEICFYLNYLIYYICWRYFLQIDKIFYIEMIFFILT